MEGSGPFLWLNEYGPAAGFRKVPPGGMCVSAFLFVEREGSVLVGKMREHPEWERLAGLDAARVRRYANGWTLPARQLKFGEDPREAARQIGEEVLGLPALRYGEPRVEVEHYELREGAWGPPERKAMYHYDISFFVDAAPPPGMEVRAPAWYAELAWHDVAALPRGAWARSHEDVAARWLERRLAP